jgi:hypothetical protein
VIASLNVPGTGGESRIASQATHQEYFIFLTSSQFNNSPGFLDLAISICSINQDKISVK